MVWIASARRTTALTFLAAGMVSAQTPAEVARSQTALPPTSPTDRPPSAGPASAAAPNPPAHPAQVYFADGQLQIFADGSSLNQILRDIGKVTSIAITGGVGDQPVYGTYGPGTPGDVLSTLLEGTGCNMMLRESTTSRHGELILTQRAGGASPPNPNPAPDNNAATFQAIPPRPAYQPPPENPPTIQPATTDSSPQQPAPALPANSSATPGGSQTPEQIYQQLQRMQQAQPHP
jgi:hypothetical protein